MSLSELIQSWLSSFNLGDETSTLMARIILALAVLLIGIIAFIVSRRIVSGGVHLSFKRSRFTWDDHLLENNLFMRLTLIVPALIVHIFIPVVFDGYPRAGAVAIGTVYIYFICVTVLVLDALINSMHAIYQTFRVSREIPLKGFTQVLKITLSARTRPGPIMKPFSPISSITFWLSPGNSI